MVVGWLDENAVCVFSDSFFYYCLSNECAKMIIQSGIKEVVFLSDKYHDLDEFRASRVLLTMAKVRMRQYTPSVPSLRLYPRGILEDSPAEKESDTP